MVRGAALAGALRPAVYAIDKDQPVGAIQPLEEILGATIAKQRFAMLLLVVFSSVALVIAAVGIYGVMAYSVVQRTGEFGIRMALGAQRSDVLRLVLSHAGKLVSLGLVIGLGATFAASRLMGSMLFQTNAHDPLTFGLTTIAPGCGGDRRLSASGAPRHASQSHRSAPHRMTPDES